jgi:hypothetical protein
MTLNRGALRATIAIFFSVLVVVYAVAWSLPAVGLDHDDATLLITAKAIAAGHGYTIDSLPDPVPQTGFPPLFPAVLALFTLISQQTLWLKALPLACAVIWLILTRKLLLKMGASRNSALLLLGLTAASPTVVFLSTNLLPETLFAMLVTASLLALLEERALLAGVLAGLATLTEVTGTALIVACILTLVVRRRFRGAATFAAVAMVMVAPWFGWSLAHMTHGAYAANSYVTPTFFTGLAANEKLVVVSRNLIFLLASPFSLLTGLTNTLAVIGAVIVLGWCFFVRRQLVPDLFIGLYCVVLLCRVSSPERLAAPILPLVFWMVWRVFRLMQRREALVALVLISAVLPLWADVTRVLPSRANGYFQLAGAVPDNWNDMRKLFEFIRTDTEPNSVLLANMDGSLFLGTGRKTVRGFAPNGFDLYYSPRLAAATPDQLSKAIVQSHVKYVVVTPDRGLAESPSFHKSMEALERGAVVEPVGIPGVSREYQLFRVR